MITRSIAFCVLASLACTVANAASDKWTVPAWYISRQVSDELFIVEGPFKDQPSCETERRAVLGQYADKVEVNCAFYASDPEDF